MTKEYRSNCCNAGIDLVAVKKGYGICHQCFTRIGYHEAKDDAKYDPYNIGCQAGRASIIEDLKELRKDQDYYDKPHKAMNEINRIIYKYEK